VKHTLSLIALLIGIGAVAACGTAVTQQDRAMDTTTTRHIKALEGQRILFGHQSVGDNLMDGLTELVAANAEAGLKVVRVDDTAAAAGDGLFHFHVGKNGDPLLKLSDFAKRVESASDPFDIAMVKLCYVDITQRTDVTALFHEYQSTMTRLASKYPETRFVHITVPITGPKSGVRAALKRALGETIDPSDNITREMFNAKMRDAYAHTGTLVDLAKVESTSPDGTRTTHRAGDKNYFMMVGEYTDDGGHLNGRGKRIVVPQFLQGVVESAVADSA
jgi:hypothetical protein